MVQDGEILSKGQILALTILALTVLALTIFALTILALTILALTVLTLTVLALTVLALTVLALTIAYFIYRFENKPFYQNCSNYIGFIYHFEEIFNMHWRPLYIALELQI